MHAKLRTAALGVALAAGAAAQDAPAAGDPPVGDLDRFEIFEAQFVDGVLAVVGDEIIRLSDVRGMILSDRYRDDIPGYEQMDREDLVAPVLIERIKELLKVQGGRNQGYDPLTVEIIRDRAFDRRVEELGGHQSASVTFRSWGFTPSEFKRFIEDQLLARTWEDSMSGVAAGPTGRPSVDRYVRPGILWSTYRTMAESPDPDERERIGERAPRMVVRQLALEYFQHGGIQRTRELAERLRQELESDELGFEQAVNRFGHPRYSANGGLLDPMTERDVAFRSRVAFGDDRLATWASTARPGDVSPPFELAVDGKPSALVLYGYVEDLPGEPATPFEDLDLQIRLTESLQEDLDRVRVSRALDDLLRTTYVHPAGLKEELLRPSGPGRPPASPPAARGPAADDPAR